MTRRVCRAAAIALTGLVGTPITVEAAVSQQLPGMAIIGLPDTALAEAKLRVRTATSQAALPLSDRFITVNLSPAALPKQGSGFDLAIALAALAASGHLPDDRLMSVAHIGELGLDGALRRPAGLLSAVVEARRLGFTTVMVPGRCADEARLVPGIEIVAVSDLHSAVLWHRGDSREQLADAEVSNVRAASPAARSTDAASEPGEPHRTADISDIIGQPEAIDALTVAAAGRHHLSLLGPPGAGKTMLAMSLPSILPDLAPDESIIASSIRSLGGAPLTRLISRPPFESPHHTASDIAIIGGGDSAGVRPGAITRACYGVLFLDEAPEFSRAVLDGLRQPLESGEIEIHRARMHAHLPARFQLVIAANPCPCGNAGSPDTAEQCVCTAHTRIRYLQRISGPLRDRIDVRLTVRRVASVLWNDPDVARPDGDAIRARVTAARRRAAARLEGTPWTVNAEVKGSWLRSPQMKLPRADTAVLDQAFARGSLTGRGYDRTLRIAWTLADLAGKDRPERRELAHALALRGGTHI